MRMDEKMRLVAMACGWKRKQGLGRRKEGGLCGFAPESKWELVPWFPGQVVEQQVAEENCESMKGAMASSLKKKRIDE